MKMFDKVQFFGLQGAGKTFLGKNLAKTDNFKFIGHCGKTESYFLSFCFSLLHPRIFIQTQKLLFEENKHNRKLLEYKKQLFRRAASVHIKSFGRRAIIEEGFCQFALTMFERNITEDDLTLFKKLIPKSTKIIIVETDPDTRLKRLKEKKKLPRAFLGAEYFFDFINPIWIHNAEVIKKYYKEHFNTETIKN